MSSGARSSPVIWRIALRITIRITTCHQTRFAAKSRFSARLGSGFSPTPSRTSRGSNGLDPAGRSWRHGSIAHRIAFLEGLERRPDREGQFQRGVCRLRIGLGVVLVMAILLSFVTQIG